MKEWQAQALVDITELYKRGNEDKGKRSVETEAYLRSLNDKEGQLKDLRAELEEMKKVINEIKTTKDTSSATGKKPAKNRGGNKRYKKPGGKDGCSKGNEGVRGDKRDKWRN